MMKQKIFIFSLLLLLLKVNGSGFQKCDLTESVYELKSPPSSVTPKPDRYELPEIKLHIDKLSLSTFESNKDKYMSCIDARDTDAVFGTPGGKKKIFFFFLK